MKGLEKDQALGPLMRVMGYKSKEGPRDGNGYWGAECQVMGSWSCFY